MISTTKTIMPACQGFEDKFDNKNLGELLNTARLDFAANSVNVSPARSLVASMISSMVSSMNSSGISSAGIADEANLHENMAKSGWDITVSTLDEIKVAVSEAVSNAIIHGYDNDATKTVRMQVWQYPAALVVQVRDDGVGIEDVRRAMEPDYTTGVEHLGLGFAFMNSFMDELWVESAPGCGTTVTMLKMLSVNVEPDANELEPEIE
jgi:stage II sporulation protein AB (anti-sigma F factor)